MGVGVINALDGNVEDAVTRYGFVRKGSSQTSGAASAASCHDVRHDLFAKTSLLHHCLPTMSWLSKKLEPTAAHYSYLIVSAFLILYALFSQFIRNRLHLSEPPLATLVGIAFGPLGVGVLDLQKLEWEDNVIQEVTRIIVGVQVFVVGVELPKAYFSRHWKSVAMMLGPVMIFSWLISAAFIFLLLKTNLATSLIISACLAPTDPVLAASVLADSHFSRRIPRRLRHLLSAESGCNDGVSFPLIYVGLYGLIQHSTGSAIKEWLLSTILWQCLLGLSAGLLIGHCANRALRFAQSRQYISSSSFFVFYFLLAIFSIGFGSLLGLDDFLVAFGAGTGFAWDGWFANKTKSTHLPNTIDLLLNSTMFVYFGAIIPWTSFKSTMDSAILTPGKLSVLLILVILFRRIPVLLALKPWIPDVKTYREALFCGHFGPMGLGALFLSMEARAQLETGTSRPDPHPPAHSPFKKSIDIVWPVVSFIILGSIMIHGFSVAAISVSSHYSRPKGEREPLIGSETEGLAHMVHEGGGGESEPSVSGDEDPDPVS